MKSTEALETPKQVRIPPNTKYLEGIQQLASDTVRYQEDKY